MHHVLAAVYDMHLQFGVHLLQQFGALTRMSAILAAKIINSGILSSVSLCHNGFAWEAPPPAGAS